jgi:predicted phosphohydrolase
MNLGFDVISDLQLESMDFDWDDRATSLYCLIPGNISDDMEVVRAVLTNLSAHYQGVFFIDGSYEHYSVKERDVRTRELTRISKAAKNVVYLHDNVVIIDGVALIGANGWHGTYTPEDTLAEIELVCAEYEDVSYLTNTIKKLQLHPDVKKIVILTSSVPLTKLFYGDEPKSYSDVKLDKVLEGDTEKKVSHWIFGSTDRIIDIMQDDINYVNNPKFTRMPYYAKRIEVLY